MMYHADEGFLASTNELMLMNIDYATRRSAPWPEWAMPRIEAMAAAHRTPAQAQTGRPHHRHQEEVAYMSVILPYEMPALVTTAPLDIHRSTVRPDWVDWNGHMNVAFYVTAFDQASGAFMRNIGLGRHYVDGKHGMTFVLETHVTYDREMKGGAPMRFTTQLLDRDAKRVHLFHEMYPRQEGYLAATNETIVNEYRLRLTAVGAVGPGRPPRGWRPVWRRIAPAPSRRRPGRQVHRSGALQGSSGPRVQRE
jgi:acyl-CoA thioester hydrolase